MLTDHRCSPFVLLAALLCCGCVAPALDEEPGDAPPGEADAALTASNATTLNGITPNGITPNGTTLNGITPNGITLNGITLNGITPNGTVLSGTTAAGAILTGVALVGAELTAVMSDGSELTLRIDGYHTTPDPEIRLYTVVYESGASWPSLCGTTSGGAAVRALALSGVWDYSQGTSTGGDHIADPSMFTFACEGSALAKCAQLGYKPWKTVTECSGGDCATLSTRHLHQACTRMIRADYCGDGTPHTMNGVPIDLWDNFGIQARASVGSGWKLEAEWSPEGALCIKDLRYDPQSATSAYVDLHCKNNEKAKFSCFGTDSTFFTNKGWGESPATRSLLRDEFDYAWVYDATNGG